MVFDAVSEVRLFILVFISVYTLVLFAYVITSWVQLPYSLRGVQTFLYDVCEPYLRLWRRILPVVRCARPVPDGRDLGALGA